MARASDQSTVMQVAVPRELNHALDQISAKTHVAKSVIIRMGIQKIIKEIKAGNVKLGISFGEDDEEGSGEAKLQVTEDPTAAKE